MNPLTQAVGSALLHVLWQATAIAIVLALVLARMARRSANARYVASVAALALVLTAFVATALRAYEPAVPEPSGTAAAVLDLPVVDAVALTQDTLDAWSSALERALPAIVALWLAGVVLLAARLLVSWSRVRRLARDGVAPRRPEWEAAAARVTELLGIRRAVRLLESGAVELPGVIGALRPVVLIPASALTGLSPSDIEMLLAHELAHVRRHDYLLNLLQSVVETLFFFHPAVWWISRRVRDEREHCCDDLAVAVCGSPTQYARALTRLEELRSAPHLVAAAGGGSLLGRIRRIAGQGAEAGGQGAPWAAAFLLLTILAVLTLSPSLPSPAQAGTRVEPVAEEPVTPEAVPEPVEPAEESHAPLVAVEPTRERVRPSIDELISLKAAGVDGAYIKAMRELFPTLTLRQASHLGASGVTPEYVREMRSAGFFVESAGTASSLRALGVTAEFVQSMRKAGLQVTKASDATSLAAVGVTPEYIAAMRNLGFDVEDVQEVTGLKATGVTPEWVKAMRQAGVEVSDPSDAAGLRALGVSPDFVRRMAKAGYGDLTVSELQNLAAHGIDESFIEEMEQYRKKERDVR